MTVLDQPTVSETTVDSKIAALADAAVEPAATDAAPAAEAAPDVATVASEPAVSDEPVQSSPETLLIRSALEVEAELTDLDDELSELHEKKESLSKKIKGKEEEREEKVRELRDVLRGRGQSTLPFKKPAGKPAAESNEKSPTAPAPVASTDEAWRAVTLEQLGITKPKTVQILTEQELTTLGAIADYTADGKNRIADIKGIGPAAVQLIDDKIADYWVKNPRTSTPAAEQAAEAASPPEAVAIEPIPAAELGLTHDPLNGAWNPAGIEQIAKHNSPGIAMLTITDPQSRFVAGKYIVAEVSGDEVRMVYTLLPVFDEASWKSIQDSYARDGKAMTGALAGEYVRDAEGDNTPFHVGSTDSTVWISVDTEILVPADFGLESGAIAALAHVNLLTQAPYAGAGPIPALRGTVKVGDVEHVVTQGTRELGFDVYALRPLEPKVDREPVAGDEFYGRQVQFGDVVLEIGPKDKAIYVRDASN